MKTPLLLLIAICFTGVQAQDTLSVPASTSADTSYYSDSSYADTVAAVEEQQMPAVKPKMRAGVLTECPEDMEYIISRQKRKVREFCIDRYEYPNKKGERPMADITWYKADQLCEKAGKRLCADWEWEDACAGLNKWDYAYHNVYDETKCNEHGEEVAKSGDFPDCMTKNYLLWDMVGNLQEWTSGGGVGASGGTYKNKKSARCSKWDALSLKEKNDKTGFRCCVSVNTGRFGKVKGVPPRGMMPRQESAPAPVQ
ncbi:MAG: SUMF1/EgtB/PvdO family nonheme iron enzyme [Fibrobacteres bacterium]|nr:SUMF1/EgtB/PvdO family nonheme iron enzyme [Fibrobacterota bacterium]